MYHSGFSRRITGPKKTDNASKESGQKTPQWIEADPRKCTMHRRARRGGFNGESLREDANSDNP